MKGHDENTSEAANITSRQNIVNQRPGGSWLGRQSGRRLDLEFLLGYLIHAAMVVKPRRIFLLHFSSYWRRLRGCHFVNLNAMHGQSRPGKVELFPAELAWRCICSTGQCPKKLNAAGNLGCWAVTSSNRWLQVQWPDSWSWSVVSIATKKIASIMIAAATWGLSWHHCNVAFHCDKVAVVLTIQIKSKRNV